MPSDYLATLKEIKQRIRSERLRVVMAANATMILMYWEIGRIILTRQEAEGWGAKVIDRLSVDLREEFADMQGLSARNLKYMRAFAEAWPNQAIVQRTIAQLPWRTNLALIEKLADPDDRLWYARHAAENGWSREILELQIQSGLHHRQGKAVSNFALALPPADSDMAAQVFKDPYLFDFIGTADPRREREVEQALVDHAQKFLLELGAGFAFVGRQVHLEFASKDYYLDLLFYHLKLRCFVVVELKAVPFEPEFVGKLNMYMGAVDDLLRHADDKPTIGLLLCKGKDRIVAEYALSGFVRPIGVADWKSQLTEALPADLKGSLPTVEEIETELSEMAEQVAPNRANHERSGEVRELIATEQGSEQQTEQVARLLAAMGRTPLSAREIMAKLGLTHRPTFLYSYLQPALADGLIEMTRPDAPRARNQKYRKTAKGRHPHPLPAPRARQAGGPLPAGEGAEATGKRLTDKEGTGHGE